MEERVFDHPLRSTTFLYFSALLFSSWIDDSVGVRAITLSSVTYGIEETRTHDIGATTVIDCITPERRVYIENIILRGIICGPLYSNVGQSGRRGDRRL